MLRIISAFSFNKGYRFSREYIDRSRYLLKGNFGDAIIASRAANKAR